MFSIIQEENRRIEAELSVLRRVIMQVDPVVMVDGRFEETILKFVRLSRDPVESGAISPRYLKKYIATAYRVGCPSAV